MTATHSLNSTASVAPVLYVAFELSAGQGLPDSHHPAGLPDSHHPAGRRREGREARHTRRVRLAARQA